MAGKRSEWDVPRRIILYDDEATPSLKLRKIAEYVERNFGISVRTKGGFLKVHSRGGLEELAHRIAKTKVRDLSRPSVAVEPSYGEIAFELRLLEDPTKMVPGVLYDGGRMMSLLRALLPASERKFDIHHIVFTSRLVGTFEPDGRYHAHVNICGYPSIISTSGIVEAPAKPREYYVMKQKFVEAGETVPFEMLKEHIAGRFIDYDDPRLTDIMKGYALQCILYLIMKEPFCKIKDCRLFDAHWQSEVIRAQLGKKEFCAKHKKIIEDIRRLARKSKR